MFIFHFFEEEIISSVKNQLKLIEEGSKHKTVLVLSCANNNFTADEYKNKSYKKGLLLVGFMEKSNIKLIKNISNPKTDFESNLNLDLKETNTLFTFVDGYSKRIDSFLDAVFNSFGLSVNYIGGGAGYLDCKQRPVLITSQGLIEDAAILATFNFKSASGVKHGWKDFKGPFKITKAEKNKIIEINLKPAFEIYKECIDADAPEKINNDNFFEIAKKYPFGLIKFSSEKIVRDPYKLNSDKSIDCVGEIPENSLAFILKGEKNLVLNAAIEAFKHAKLDYMSFDKKNKVAFIANCISRKCFLDDDFSTEIENITPKDFLNFGALTIGEIANGAGEYLEFHNKTLVVCLL